MAGLLRDLVDAVRTDTAPPAAALGLVVDRLDPTLAPAVVANVSLGLALFASPTSQVGDGLTRLADCRRGGTAPPP